MVPLRRRFGEFADSRVHLRRRLDLSNSNAFIEFMLDKINMAMDWALRQASEKDAYLPETVQKLLDIMEHGFPYSAIRLMEKPDLKSKDNSRKAPF